MLHHNSGFAGAGLLLALAALWSCTVSNHETPPVAESGTVPSPGDHEQAFDRLKTLEGDYIVGSPARPSLTVSMRSIARGTALQEEWAWPGGARELTVFFMDNGTLRATHYCHSGIQSTMALQDAQAATSLVFRISSATNLLSPGTAHNSGFGYVIEADGAIRRSEDWTENGRVTSSEVRLVRRPESSGVTPSR